MLLLNNKVYAVPANAGADTIIYAGDTVRIGTTGYKNHTYRWSPTTGLSDTTVARPFASPLYSTYYILTVTDPLNNVSVDTVYVGVLVRIDGGFPVHHPRQLQVDAKYHAAGVPVLPGLYCISGDGQTRLGGSAQ